MVPPKYKILRFADKRPYPKARGMGESCFAYRLVAIGSDELPPKAEHNAAQSLTFSKDFCKDKTVLVDDMFKMSYFLALSALLFFIATGNVAGMARNDPAEEVVSSSQNSSRVSALHGLGSLRKRMDLDILHFDHVTSLQPLQQTAELLVRFYFGVAANADGLWADNKERVWVRMLLGELQLLMTATKGHTIPWSFVSWFAVQMLEFTERGYVGTYDAFYVTPNGNGGIWVSLTLRLVGPLVSANPADWGGSSAGGAALNPQAQAWFPQRGVPT